MSSFQRVRDSDLATVANSAICGLLPPNNSYNINYKVTKNGNMDSFPLDPRIAITVSSYSIICRA